MLIDFQCSNFRSFLSEINFTMLSGQDDSHGNELISLLGEKSTLLRTAVIYGANGSGKSNFVQGLQLLRSMVITSIKLQPGTPIVFMPHIAAKPDMHTHMSIRFFKNDVLFHYTVMFNQESITEESLTYYPQSRPVKIFKRSQDSYSAGAKYTGKFNQCSDVLKPNRLFLSCAANYSSVPEVASAFEFFMKDLVIYCCNGIVKNWLDYSLRAMNKDISLKQTVLRILKSLGTGITGLDIKQQSRELPLEMIQSAFTPEIRNVLTQTKDFFEAWVRYGNYPIPLGMESSGIQKLLGFLCPLIDILTHGRILVCDELETHFHESIVHQLIALIQTNTRSPAQMIFTTHDTNLLDLDVFRRDQIWFTELSTDSHSTDLYSLAEIRNVRKDENLAKGYMNGRYGAIPLLNHNITQILEESQRHD